MMNIAYVVVFFAALWAGLIETVWPVIDIAALEERRQLASIRNFWPRLTRLDPSLGADVNYWFDDHFGFRPLFVKLRNEADYRIFATSRTVLIGKNEYLFQRAIREGLVQAD